MTIDSTQTYTYSTLHGVTFEWEAGSTHTVAYTDPVPVGGGSTEHYTFVDWGSASADFSGTPATTFTTPSSDTSVTVNYVAQWHVTFTLSGMTSEFASGTVLTVGSNSSTHTAVLLPIL